MAKKSGTKGYNTNLAAEFHMMSLFHRAQLEPSLSLGNKKGVDIVLYHPDRAADIIEVKGVADKMDWMIGDKVTLPALPNMYYALVCFNRRIGELMTSPDFWLIPSMLLAKEGEYAVASNGKTVFLRNAHIRKNYEPYMNTFEHLSRHTKTWRALT